MKKAKGYVDVYLFPVPKKNFPAYKKIAAAFAKIIEGYGALEYREFVSDGKPDMLPKTIPYRSNEVLVSALAVFKSKAHRNQVFKKIMFDEKMTAMMKEMEKKPIFDMKKMLFGGFKTFIEI